MYKLPDKLIDILISDDIKISEDDESAYVELSFFSPEGQDCSLSIEKGNNIECFCNNVYDYYDNFDVSYETYLWLDSDGHGSNGAPYDMKDVYEDMAWCQNKIYDIFVIVQKYIDETRRNKVCQTEIK